MSLSDIESMINEEKTGEDLFAVNKTNAQVCNCTSYPLKIEKKRGCKVWVCPYLNTSNHWIDGHYIHLDLETEKEGTSCGNH